MSVPSVGTGAVVGAHVAPLLARGLYVSLRRGESMLGGTGAPVLTLQGSGALMTLWGLGRGGSHP
jgi:hypothetical protein